MIVIPAEVRRRLGLREGSQLEMVVEEGEIRLLVPRSLRDAFGADGEKALEVAKLINASRNEELGKEIRH